MKRLKIKTRKRLKIKRPTIKVRHSLTESELFWARQEVIGKSACSWEGCSQPSYYSDTKECYYHSKVKRGLIDASVYRD